MRLILHSTVKLSFVITNLIYYYQNDKTQQCWFLFLTTTVHCLCFLNLRRLVFKMMLQMLAVIHFGKLLKYCISTVIQSSHHTPTKMTKIFCCSNANLSHKKAAQMIPPIISQTHFITMMCFITFNAHFSI